MLRLLCEFASPDEDILRTTHVEQAYSYAMHSEVRVQYYALCNGKQFVLYHVSKAEPVLNFSLTALSLYWGELEKHLSPSNVLNVDSSYKKDFGLHLKRLGFDEFTSIIIPDVPITQIAKLNENHYSFSAGPKFDEETYVATFDFDAKAMVQLYGKIPHKVFELFSTTSPEATKCAVFPDLIYKVTVDCRVGEKLEENKKEIFLPLRINRILDHLD